jgi:4-cresol dehydrogenase (hydroxylating)
VSGAAHRPQPVRLPEALAAWREAIGDASVIDDPVALRAAGHALVPTDHRIAAILRPADPSEVQACLRIAGRCGVPLHPVSRGRNWGYGAWLPPAQNGVVLSLDRLDRIRDFSEELAYVTIEPGVTFRRLDMYLRQRGSRLVIGAIGGPGDASVLANALERGTGVDPHADRFSHVCGLEVVLPTGELLRTGSARQDGAHAGPVDRWGVGPWLDGLFSQSALGVVTAMTVWLVPAPRCLGSMTFRIAEPEGLAPAVDALRRLRLSGVLTTPPVLWNDIKVLARYHDYPWEEAGGRTPLPAGLRRTAREKLGYGPWSGVVRVYAGGEERCRADLAQISAALPDCVDDVREAVAPIDLEGLRTGEAPLPPTLEHDDMGLRCLYWRKRGGTPRVADPMRDGCGILWLPMTLPFTGRHAGRAVAIAEEVIVRHGFEPNLSLVGITPRVLHMKASIIYDRDAPGEADKARACHDEALTRLVEAGYPPHRLGLASAGALPPAGDASAALLRKLKETVDPHGALAGGWYLPGEPGGTDHG